MEHSARVPGCVAILLGLSLLACGGATQLTPTKGRPEWIDKGGGFFSGDKGTAFYGVGAASNISIPSLRRTTAEAQARADIARVFKSRISNLVKAYSRSISGGGDAANAKESMEQFAQEATKAFTSMELSGVLIVDRYYDEKERTQYALAVMDLAAFKDQVSQMRDLSEQAQEAIKANADEAFGELDLLEAKSGQ